MVDRVARTNESGAVAVGEAAERVEWARSFAADAAHLRARFAAVQTDPRAWDGRFADAGRALAADARDRFDGVSRGYRDDPDGEFDRDIADTPAEAVVTDAYLGAESVVETLPEPDERPASAALAGCRADRDLRAFERVREAVAEGAYGRPDDAAAVRTGKLDAVEAVERARSDGRLTRRVASAAAYDLRGGDRYLARYGEASDDPDTVSRAVGEYALAAARAEAAPGAATRLEGLLRGTRPDDPHD